MGDIIRFHAMLKPSGAQCNLDCSYCFYLHKQDLLQQDKQPRMGDSLLAAHIRQYLAAQGPGEVVFSWQGGEPTLMGLDFFRRVVALQQQYRQPGQQIGNDLQTNGILLDEDWCRFLKTHDFLVGLSIDGPAALHDRHRYSKGGKPTFERVMRAVSLLHTHRIAFTALCVVNRDNARRPLDVYRFLRDEVRPRMIQFIPGVQRQDFHQVAPGHWPDVSLPPIGSERAQPGTALSVVTPWTVPSEDWGYFLVSVWREWLRHDVGRVFVDQFENVISQLWGNGAQKCVSAAQCGRGIAIEHNGDVYSCDHYVYPEYRLGNLLETPQAQLVASAQQQAFGAAKSASLPVECRRCRFLSLCYGECPKNRFVRSRDGEAGLNYLCSGLKAFYAQVVADQPLLQKKLQPKASGMALMH